MKFLPLPDFVTVTSALNFDTPDCHVSGGCDLYTTKSTGQDKKLYKNIDKSLETQHAALVKFGKSLSGPQLAEMSTSLNLSRSSPFGSLADISSRRTFAYLIATLNASHPDYDFSHVLRPSDFKREKNLRRVMNNLDSTLGNVRAGVGAGPDCFSLSRSCSSDSGPAELAWGPQTWALIDKEMTLEDCTVFSYQPAENPFDEEEGAIWTLHYFFFNKTLKRVAYLHVRGLPVTSHSRPGALDGSGYSIGGRLHGAGASGTAGAYDDDSSEEYGALSSSLKRSGGDMSGASKRARFWFGDRAADRVRTDSDDEMDDGMIWNRTADGEFNDDYRDYDDEDDDDVRIHDEDDLSEEDAEESETGLRVPIKGPVRAVSEDIASRMEIE